MDWGDPALQVKKPDFLGAFDTLDAGALEDGEVDFNVTFAQADATDSVTVRIDYTYDYWYLA
ncbi:hypothetical protein D3C83_232640 [compost metagenome]